MRDYGVVSPKFWIGETGKALRGNPEAQLVALYLMTCPHANMIGVFHCPLIYISHETGISFEGASKALASLSEALFCTYDEATETVFVHRMAAYQVGETLKAEDNRVKSVVKEWQNIGPDVLQQAFAAIYSEAFHLPVGAKKARGSKAPSKPLRSQEQEQEQEQDKPASPAFVLPDWIPAEPWAGYVEMRKKKRAPMTHRALQLKVAELHRFHEAGHDIGSVLDKSTANCWTDVYEPKGTPAGKQADVWAGAV
jgi:hypothetical protein